MLLRYDHCNFLTFPKRCQVFRSFTPDRGSDQSYGFRRVCAVVVMMTDDGMAHWAAREPHQTRNDADTVAVRRFVRRRPRPPTGTKNVISWSENAEPRLSRAVHHSTTHTRRASTHGLPTVTHQRQQTAVVDRLGRLAEKAPTSGSKPYQARTRSVLGSKEHWYTS